MRSSSVLSLSVSLSVLLLASAVASGCVITTTAADADAGTFGPGPDGGPAPSGPDSGTPTPDGGGPGPQGPILRTLVYHHLTAGENGGADQSKGIAFSRDGTTGLYDENDPSGYRPTVVRSDGTGRHALDAVNDAGWIDMSALSGDGSLAAYTTGSLLISGVATPSRVTGPNVSQSAAWSRWAKDPDAPSAWRLYFTTSQAFGDPAKERGIYSVASSGGSVKALLSLTQAAAVTGVPFNELAPKGSLRRGFDVSADGKRYVSVWSAGYCTQAGQKDYIIAASTDGSAPRLLAGPITTNCGVSKLALSGDGTTVTYAVETGAGGATRDLTVIGFDGGGKRNIAVYPGNLDTDWGLSDDGRVVLAGYQLHRTDGSGAFDLVVRGGFFSGDPATGIENQLGVLNGAGNRVFFIDAQATPPRVALLEIDPASTGAAPVITEPTATPASVPLDGSESATITAKVAGTGGAKPLRVAAAVLKNGARDETMTEVVLLDDGTHGDVTANDGVYTSNEVHARAGAGATAGPRTVRIRATFIDGATKAHSTVIEYTGLSVE